MNRDVMRALARAGWPVVQKATGAHGEIVYPYIREIKVIYASPDERAKGYPRERLAAVLADWNGNSYTEVQASGLRLPTNEEAARRCVDRSAHAVAEMCAGLDKLRETEDLP